MRKSIYLITDTAIIFSCAIPSTNSLIKLCTSIDTIFASFQNIAVIMQDKRVSLLYSTQLLPGV